MHNLAKEMSSCTLEAESTIKKYSEYILLPMKQLTVDEKLIRSIR